MRYTGPQAATGNLLLPVSSRIREADVAALFFTGALFLLWVYEGRLPLHRHAFPVLPAALTAGFALVAWLLGGVSASGAAAGGIIAFILASRDVRLFWILLLVFVVTLAATRAGRASKRAAGTEDAQKGRTASQVAANLGVAAACIVIGASGQVILVALAALAEVSADTCSSEVGEALRGRTILITSGKEVPPGTDGGLSLAGTVAGTLAAALVAFAAWQINLATFPQAIAVYAAANIGMLADSVLGALLERRRLLNNDAVNLLGSAIAAGVMGMLLWSGFQLR